MIRTWDLKEQLTIFSSLFLLVLLFLLFLLVLLLLLLGVGLGLGLGLGLFLDIAEHGREGRTGGRQ